MAPRYVAEVRKLAAGRERVTDKMPSNYYFAGLIQLALPNAKIIHTVRDPVDTCISCFSKLFSAEQNHTYDLGELGRYYKRYEQLMAHWHRVLPGGSILDVRYEDVVADLETQARRIIAYCGLSWDHNCLSFHKTDRPGAYCQRDAGPPADLQQCGRPLACVRAASRTAARCLGRALTEISAGTKMRRQAAMRGRRVWYGRAAQARTAATCDDWTVQCEITRAAQASSQR